MCLSTNDSFTFTVWLLCTLAGAETSPRTWHSAAAAAGPLCSDCRGFYPVFRCACVACILVPRFRRRLWGWGAVLARCLLFSRALICITAVCLVWLLRDAGRLLVCVFPCAWCVLNACSCRAAEASGGVFDRVCCQEAAPRRHRRWRAFTLLRSFMLAVIVQAALRRFAMSCGARRLSMWERLSNSTL